MVTIIDAAEGARQCDRAARRRTKLNAGSDWCGLFGAGFRGPMSTVKNFPANERRIVSRETIRRPFVFCKITLNVARLAMLRTSAIERFRLTTLALGLFGIVIVAGCG